MFGGATGVPVMGNGHMGTPPGGQTETTISITFPQLRLRAVLISVMINLVLTNLESDSGCLLVLLMNRRLRMILLNLELVLRARKR